MEGKQRTGASGAETFATFSTALLCAEHIFMYRSMTWITEQAG